MRAALPWQYLRLWRSFYTSPRRFASDLSSAPSPRWGLLASVQRSLMDSLLLYLPLYLMGRLPPEPSYIGFIPNKVYYAALVGIAPVVLVAEWLLAAAAAHLVLRLAGRRSDIDQILNISGFVALGIGSVLLVWDWIWVLLGGMNQYWLGISHLVIDLWGVAVTALAFKKILGLPVLLGAALSILGIAAALPLAIMFMRSPL